MSSQFREASAKGADAAEPSARATDAVPCDLRGSADGAVDALYRAEQPGLLRRFARKAGGSDEAMDIVHDAFVRLLGLGPARLTALADEQPGAYLNRTTGNLVRDRHKIGARRSVHLHVVADEATLHGPDPLRQLEARDELQRVTAALMQLRPRPRAIYFAHRVEGLSYAEIAAQCGMSVKGVEKHMAHAIAAMNRLLDCD